MVVVIELRVIIVRGSMSGGGFTGFQRVVSRFYVLCKSDNYVRTP